MRAKFYGGPEDGLEIALITQADPLLDNDNRTATYRLEKIEKGWGMDGVMEETAIYVLNQLKPEKK